MTDPSSTPTSRAYQRFLAALSPIQQLANDVLGYVPVVSNLGHTWRIYTGGGYIGNVFNEYTQTFCCCHIRRSTIASIPIWDHFLAQALMLRTDENEFMRLAYHVLP